MQAIKVAATIEKEGELHLKNLPLRSTQRVEVIVLIRDEPPSISLSSPTQVSDDEWRQLLETIRTNEPHFPTLDDAMSFSRSRP